MKTINISISEKDYLEYGFTSKNLTFKEIEEKVRKKIALDSLEKSHKIAQKSGLSRMSMEEINREVKEARKNNAEDNS